MPLPLPLTLLTFSGLSFIVDKIKNQEKLMYTFKNNTPLSPTINMDCGLSMDYDYCINTPCIY